MGPVDYLRGCWGLSSAFWLILYLYKSFRIKKFIVNRYKYETDLTNTAFFRNHLPFVLYLSDYLSAGFFCTHLMMCVWGWRIFGKRKTFKDIDSPDFVTRHFSKKEIRQAKWVLASGFLFMGHCVAYFLFLFIWPETFG